MITKIKVQVVDTSALYHDQEWDWGEFMRSSRVDIHHIAMRCRHDCIYYDREVEDMYCPDCQNEQLNEPERLEYLRAILMPEDESDED